MYGGSRYAGQQIISPVMQMIRDLEENIYTLAVVTTGPSIKCYTLVIIHTNKRMSKIIVSDLLLYKIIIAIIVIKKILHIYTIMQLMPNAEGMKLKLAGTSRIELHIVTELHNLFSSI